MGDRTKEVLRYSPLTVGLPLALGTSNLVLRAAMPVTAVLAFMRLHAGGRSLTIRGRGRRVRATIIVSQYVMI